MSLVFLTSCGRGVYRFPPAIVPVAPAAEEFPDSGAVILNDVASLDYRVSHSGDREVLVAVLTHRRRLKILKKSGLEEARVSLSVDGYSTITNIAARSVSPRGKPQVMKRSAIVHRSGTQENPRVSDLGTAEFWIPGAAVGGIVEYRYERVYTAPDMVPVWVFANRLPVLRSEFNLTADPRVKADYRWGKEGKLVNKKPLLRRTSDGRDRLVFVEKALAPVHPEAGSPHPAWLSPWLVVGVSSAEIGESKYRMETWGHVGERMSYFADIVGDGGIIPQGSAESRFRTIRKKLNPVVAPGLGVLAPASPMAVAQGDPICSRDAAAVMVRALRDAGEDAYIALLTGNAGPPVLRGFPGLYPFIRAVVAVDVHERVQGESSCGGRAGEKSVLCSTAPHGYAFIDPFCTRCRFGELPTALTGGRALILSSKTPEWVDVPIDPPERNFTVTLSALRVSLNGAVDGDVRIAVGGEAARRVRAALEGANPDASEGQLARLSAETATALVGGASPLSVSQVQWQTPGKDESVRAAGKLTSQFNKLAYERFEVRARDLVGLAFPWKWRNLRKSLRILEGPLWRYASASVELPAGFIVDVPAPVELVLDTFGRFEATWRVEGSTLHYQRAFTLHRQVVETSDWEKFRTFLGEVRELENVALGVLRTAESG